MSNLIIFKSLLKLLICILTCFVQISDCTLPFVNTEIILCKNVLINKIIILNAISNILGNLCEKKM